MKPIAILICILLLALPAAVAQRRSPDYGLPAGARVIESVALNRRVYPDRALLLWMLRPKRNERDPSNDLYSCPDETRGSYYSGPLRVTLVDTATNRIINTVEIKQEYSDETVDSFDIPYKIHRGYYHVPGVRGSAEAKPSIMRLRDFNGDGHALEFALYDALACMGLATTLIGYSKHLDRVVQYQVVLTREEGSKRQTYTTHWVDYLFSKAGNPPGHWKYEVDYRGRGGSLDRYEIRYNRERERFEGKLLVSREE